MERIQGLNDVCLSGGADGADLEWGARAASIGHTVIHWSFAGHNTQAPESQLVRLNNEQLQLANEALQKAALALGRQISQHPILQRDYYQVAWSKACYAVAEIVGNEIPGGTGWTVKMFMQLHPDNRDLYLFDQNENAWFQFNGDIWVGIDSPPRPSGIWAGIGSRNLRENGKEAIKKLMDF